VSASYHLIRFDGELDISRYPEFRRVFEDVPAAVPVLVDLSGVRSVDSVFLSEMLLAKRRHGVRFAVLIVGGSNLAKLFGIAGLDAKMDVFTDRAAALQVLQESP
jgi:anti-anti-sigma regulatory factor